MNRVETTEALNAFRKVDFNWAARLQDVWHDTVGDVPELHGEIRREFAEKLESMRDGSGRSPLGWFMIGSGGVGKTHLIGAMRQEAARQKAGFVLVDMTDVRDFWEVVLQGYLDSLQTRYRDGKFQYEILLHRFISRVSREDVAGRNLEVLAKRKTTALADDVGRIVTTLRKTHPREALEHQDVVRALICLNSLDQDVAAAGYAWLQCLEIEDELRSDLGFSNRQRRPSELIHALSWFMSLSGPTVVAFDQLDPIVQQVKHQARNLGGLASEEEGTARSIIEQIGGGFGAMADTTFNTLTVVSCVESTLHLLNEMVLSTYLDRFESPRQLQRPTNPEVYRMLIRERLAPAYRTMSFVPPYETWPFRPEAIDELRNESAREVLKLCEQHRQSCAHAGAVTELFKFERIHSRSPESSKQHQSVNRFASLDEQFLNLRLQVDPDWLLEEKEDDERLAPLYRTAFDCLVREHEQSFPDHVEPVVEQEFSGGKTTKPLHARLRIVDHNEESREDHYCVRALQRRHHASYRTRLKAAMTQSGIDKSLHFRHLLIVRSSQPPGGTQTESLTRSFQQAGGRFHAPSEDELRTLAALKRLAENRDPDFDAWLQQRQPVSKLGLGEVLTFGTRFAHETSPDPALDSTRQIEPVEEPEVAPVPSAPAAETSSAVSQISDMRSAKLDIPPKPVEKPVSPPVPTRSSSIVNDKTELPFGRRMMGLGTLGDSLTLPLPVLAKHTMILGGSGSGKSVTVRRLVEEAALAGIPSIVVDCAQDMCLFDHPWCEPPEGWGEGDSERAERLQRQVEQIVWTPGSLSTGNPLCLRPLPDFRPVKDDPEELNDAVMMACDGLKAIVAAGNSQKARNSFGVLKHSLEYFAKHFPDRGLNEFIEFLFELPSEAELGIGNERKLAQEIASSLKVEQTTNPLLKDGGSPLDPLVLFGDDRTRETVRISVISLVRLKGQNAAHSFLNQLAMGLFSWMKQNPSPPNNRPLRGLLVIDEARDFVPSRISTECKESVMRLAAQARKYRVGVVFATQHPKDIETKIVGNCATHLYGLNNSPASLATLQDLMAQKGGSGDDIPKLKPGQFYIFNADAGHESPIKIQVPMSLSFSPNNPVEESEIMEKAAASHNRMSGF